MTSRAMATFAIVTLGCAKNEADSDVLATTLTAAGYRTASVARADLVIVNTCGFVDAAKEESIAVLLELADEVHGHGARLAAYGCLVQRHGDELAVELPEVDLWVSFDHQPLLDALRRIAAGSAADTPPPVRRRRRPLHAYVKVSDGCDRACSYCAIPLIRGRYRTVPADTVLSRARAALARGAREIVLVGQDTSCYSQPGYGSVARLLTDVKALGPLWLRLPYLQPDNVSARLLKALARSAVPYVDLPLQHVSRPVLAAMDRGGDRRSFLRLLERVREALPGAAIRTTFMTGFPGEDDEHFEELLAFAGEARFAVGGVFAFDPQEGTRAALLPGQVAVELRLERAARLAAALERGAAGYWSEFVGRRVEVMVERGCGTRGGEAVGRIAEQAPDVDGRTFVRGRALRRGDVVTARVEGIVGYDLMASAHEDTAGPPPSA